MEYKPVNFQEKLGKFSEHWSPKIIAQLPVISWMS